MVWPMRYTQLAKALALVCTALAVGGLGAGMASAAAKGPVALVCTVKPGVAVKGGTDGVAICEVFRGRLETAIGAPVRLAGAIPVGTRSRWVSIAITAPRPHALEVRMRSQLSGRRIDHPPLAIDVMDKTLDRRDVDTLAQHVAKQVKSR